MTFIIESNKLTKTFGNSIALKDANINVRHNSFHLILGPNGSGKSTFIKLALGLLKPTNGYIKVLGFDPFKYWYKINRRIGAALDNYSPPKWSAGKEFLKYACDLKNSDWKKFEELAEFFEVKDYWEKNIRSYSSGMLKKLSLIQAFATAEDLLILDEPFTYIDSNTQVKVLKLFEKLKGKLTILVSTHFLTGLDKLVDELSILFNGEVLLTGNIKEIFEKIKFIVLKFNIELFKKYMDKIKEMSVRILIENDTVKAVINKDKLEEFKKNLGEISIEYDIFIIYSNIINSLKS